jgi:hypothetical protein
MTLSGKSGNPAKEADSALTTHRLIKTRSGSYPLQARRLALRERGQGILCRDPNGGVRLHLRDLGQVLERDRREF